jgi:enoyl-CoA hydratase/carnithine racemase
MIAADQIDGVQVVTMDAGENRFNLAFVTALDEALAKAADAGAPLVLTGTGKYFCNGLDLEWLGDASSDDAAAAFTGLYRVMARLLAFPGAVVAAINGHAFGAGAILAGSADFRIMREDRGYFCFPEVDLGMTMSPEFNAVARAAFPLPVYREALVSGRRYGGPAALKLGLVGALASEDGLVPAAVDIVRDLAGKVGANVAALKRQLHADALAVLPSV